MDDTNRRNFLHEMTGLGAAALSVAGQGAPSRMPGRPAGAESESQTIPSTIMAIAAHPGDAFFSMGASVALQSHIGGQAVFVSLSLGERGSATVPPAEYGRLQREAAERAAGILRSQAAFLEYQDGQIPESEEAKLAVGDLIREYKPGVVLTHWRGSWHKDHQACYRITNDAIFYAGLPALARKRPAHTVGKLFFAENWEDAEGFTADTYLDISPAFDRWLEACAAFPMWRGETGFRYNDYYRSLAVARGCLSGFRYAAALMSPSSQLVRSVHAL